jgi:ABC-type branched-subunit amino acid transport system substrate-binding protein
MPRRRLLPCFSRPVPCGITGCVLLLAAVAIFAWPLGAAAQQASPLRIAAALTLSGPAANIGTEVLEGIQLGLEDAGPQAPQVDLAIVDDGGTAEGARDAARRIVDGDALAVIGPSLSAVVLAAEPIYAEADLSVIAPNIATDATAGIFRLNLGQSKVGEALADYLYHALGGRRATVIHSDDGYGQPFALGFRRGAERLGIRATYHPVSDAQQAAVAAQRAAGSPQGTAIVLGMLETTAVPVLRILKRADVPGPFLATASFAYDGYSRLFAAEPEEQANPGFFTDGLYAASPVLLDSGGAALLAFEARYRARHGREPSWRTVLAYDAMRMLLGILASARPLDTPPSHDVAARRRAVREAILALDGPKRAFPGLSGPVWFGPTRGRAAVIRIARFDRDWLESAPLQLVPATNPDLDERLTGAVVPAADGHFARLQRVVYAGVYLNEIARLDLLQSSFTADFYLWLRSAATTTRPGDAGPAEIQFPDMRRGDFDPALPAVRRDLQDGSTYRLWHVRGEFRNEFDLHRFPFDRQMLIVRLFNARAASDRIVYALDRRAVARQSPAVPARPSAGDGARAATLDTPAGSPWVSSDAFRHLTQWRALRAEARRDVLVTPSALGDPLLIGAEQVRELSGFRFEVELRRRTLSTLAKSLLPVGLMTLMMFASLWFPPALVRDKVAVAITGALSGAVLLAAINSQLGNVAYTMDVEHAFYVFFALALLCILSVSATERLRNSGRGRTALLTERATRLVFFLAVAAIVTAGWLAATQ